jgi:hypothetical protein
MCLFDCLRASGISCADLSKFIDEDWKIFPSNAAALISMIEAGEQKFKEGSLRVHHYGKEYISDEAFFQVLKKQRDELIAALRWTIESGCPLWLSLELVTEDSTADFIFGAVEELDPIEFASICAAAEELNEIQFGCHATPTSAKVIAFPTRVAEAETIDPEEALTACKSGDDVLDDAIAKIILFGITTHVLEW